MVTSITVSDERTKVTRIFLVENGNTSGQWHSVAYRVKGNNSDKLINPTNSYDYVGFESSTREDKIYAITNDGRKHTVTIGTDRVMDGLILGSGYTESANKSKSKDDIDAEKARESTKSASRCSSSSNPCNSSSNSCAGCCTCDSIGPCSICKGLWKLLCYIIK